MPILLDVLCPPGNSHFIAAESPASNADVGDAASTIEQFAYEYGRMFDSYLVTEPGREYFWSGNRKGLAAYARLGKHIEIGGGLLAPSDSERETLLAGMVECASKHLRSLSFFNIGEGDLPLFRKWGFQATKWGEEAIVDLNGLTWEGKSFEWVRRQSNFCRRNGVVVSEFRHGASTGLGWGGLLAEIGDLSAARTAARPQLRELQFVSGCFDPRHLGRKRVFIARGDGGTGRIEGFLVCNPFANGDRWAFDVYRQRPDAVRGTIPFLMHETLDTLRDEGVRSASLCLVPALRCGEPLAGDSSLARWGFMLSRYFNLIYDSAGLYHFKSRFRPRFEDRYLCVWPRVTLGSAWAFMRLVGVVDLSPLKMARIAIERWRKRESRATLAVPDDGVA